MTKLECTKILSLFTAILPDRKVAKELVTKEMVEVWHMVCRDLPFDVAQAAAMKVLASRVYTNLPMPAEIVQAAVELQQAGEPTAAEAWGLVLEAVWQDGYLDELGAHRRMGESAWAAVRAMGGWLAVCEDESPDGVLRGQFIAAYKAQAERRRDMAALPVAVRIVEITGADHRLERSAKALEARANED